MGITYVYFLIFAQFAFLTRLTDLGIADAHLKTVMGAMAVGGILLSLLAPRLSIWPLPSFRLRVGLALSAAAAFLTIAPLNFAGAVAVAFLIGAGLGLLTVTLVAHLRLWVGDRHPLLTVGAGTGIGYLVCNFPPLFTASPKFQASCAGLLCMAGIAITLLYVPIPVKVVEDRPRASISFVRILAGFTALIWLDSAAFFIIQSTPALKAGTWQGTVHLWTNGLLHLVAAFISAWWLRRKGLSPVLTGAFVALAAACLLLLSPDRALLASIFYPVGVSLYSVALVAYPSLLAPATSAAERGRRAGWLYAVAGWMGSAMGIGMGQNLGHVPPAFIAIAGAAVLLPQLPTLLRTRTRELALTALVLLAAFYLDHFLAAIGPSPQFTQVERGQQVYISEGCINCHSQYVRPNSADVLMWGPTETLAELHAQHPPLIGNRRQGPDLSQVGTRRSPLWLKAHFYNPAQVSGASVMPSYGFLFRDQRGDDLVAYLESLRGSGAAEHQAQEQLWRPSSEAMAEANMTEGQQLYQQDCANCHDAEGATRLAWKASFKRLPPDLEKGPYFHLWPTDPPSKLNTRLAQIAKFGIPGTDMPGHEYLSDREIASISLWLSHRIAQSNQQK